MCVFGVGRLQCCVVAVVVWCVLATVFFIKYNEDRAESKQLHQTNTCPVCFGFTSCYMLHSNNMHAVRLTGLSRVPLFGYVNTKNVFYGRYRGRDVVLKKLASSAEWQRLDRQVCGGSTRCVPRADLYRRLLRQVFPDLGGDGAPVSLAVADNVTGRFAREHLTCASPRLLRFLYAAHSDRSALRFYHFATMLLVNVEPLLLQAFPQSHGWPVPHYLGACGRVVFEQYIGPTLAHYRDAPWRQRVELSLQLLEIAELLTFNDYDFNLYLTDVSADNLAVDGEGRLFIVDVEDVVVVDRQHVAKHAAADWNKTHVTPILCADCMGYEPEQLCSHIVSDHNYFAVCKGLLAPDAFGRGMSGGLLHDPPGAVTSSQPELDQWLRLCADPTPTGGSRLEPAAHLRHALNRVLAEDSADR